MCPHITLRCLLFPLCKLQSLGQGLVLSLVLGAGFSPCSLLWLLHHHTCSSNSSLCPSYKKPILCESLLSSLAEVFSIQCPLWVFRAAQYFRVSLLLFAISCFSSLSFFLLLQLMYPSLCTPKPDRSVPVNLW